MSGFLLDTSAVIDWLRGRPPVSDWIVAKSTAGAEMAVSPITVAEVLAGVDPADRPPVEGILRDLTLVPISFAVAGKAAELFWQHERDGKHLPLPGLLQAACALLSERVVVTSNLRHFPDVAAVDPRQGPRDD